MCRIRRRTATLAAGSAFATLLVLRSESGLSRGFDSCDDRFAENGGRAPRDRNARRGGDEVVDRTIAWLDRNSSRRFFGPVALDLIGEVFNVTSHENYDPSTYVNVIPPDIPGTSTRPPSYSANYPIPASFGKPGQSSRDFYQPRRFQVAARVRI